MKYWILAFFLALPLIAQEEKKPEPAPPPEPPVSKLFILKYADPRNVQELLRPLGFNLNANVQLHALTVSARPRDMPAIEDAIKRLDVPPAPAPNIELTAYLITGSDSESGGAIPKELDSVVTQLRNSFPFKSYRLLDTLGMRTRSGYGANTASVSQAEGSPQAIYNNLQIRNATVNPDASSVRIDGLKAQIHIPPPGGGTGPVPLELQADVDIKPGQKVVVGRLSMGRDQALFLVLTARVVP